MFENFKIALSSTFEQWMGSFNDLLAKLEELPLPVAFGSNSQMGYLKFANGKVMMWGRVDYGRNYPCTSAWGGGQFASKDFELNFPIPLVNSDPVIIPHVMASVNADTWVLTRSTSYTTYKGCFLCAVSETDNVKTLNMLVVGDWK